MSHIRFSNIEIKGLEPISFYKNKNYKKVGINEGTSTLVPFYKDLLSKIIGNKTEQQFEDFPLSKSETESLKLMFEKELNKLIPEIEYQRHPHQKLEWKGEIYDLNLSLVSPNNRQIWDYYEIITIAKECLEEEKPMYLSLE